MALSYLLGERLPNLIVLYIYPLSGESTGELGA